MKRQWCLALMVALTLVGCGDAQKTQGMKHPVMDFKTEMADATELGLGPEAMELESVLVEEEFAKTYGGMYVRKKDGKLYSVQNIPRATWEECGIGKPIPSTSNRGWTTLYELVMDRSVLSNGDVPLVKVEAGEELCGYGVDKDVAFVNVSFAGNTIRLLEDSGSYRFLGPSAELVVDKDDIQQFEVCGMFGEEIEDYRTLEAGKNYLVSWFDEAGSNEVVMTADSKFYVTAPQALTVKSHAEPGLDGGSVFDTSGLGPGIYRVFTRVDANNRDIAVFAVR